MKTNLLLLLLASLMYFPNTHAQLLTPIPDSTNYAESEVSDLDYYVAAGFTARYITGYQEMYNFYEKQGFDLFRAQEFYYLDVGLSYKKRFYFDLNFDASVSNNNSPNDLNIGNNKTLSLLERQQAIHLLLGYRFWQKGHQSLIVHGGVSWLQNRGEIIERRAQDFDFETANINVAEGVRSWPEFIHRQGAIHIALQLRLKYPKPRWWSRDVDLKIGFVSGLKTKSWSIEPGQTLNAPNDNAHYVYMSSAYYFFSRQQ